MARDLAGEDGAGASGDERGELHGGGSVSASARRARRTSASRAAAASSVHRQRTPSSMRKVGWPWSCTRSTSRRTATTPSATSSSTPARPWAVKATSSAARTTSAARGSMRSRASDSRDRARPSSATTGAARIAAETGIACGAPPPVARTVTVPDGHSGSIPLWCPPITRREQVVLAIVAVATLAAGVARYAGAAPLLAFALATVALAGLAWVVSFATEQVGERFGPGVTGLLQSTLGNLPELFVVLFALGAGETVVAQTSILGSIFANALLVLGAVIVVGARRADDLCMRFSRRLPSDTATLLLACSFVIVVVGISLASNDPASHHVKAISSIAAIVLLGVYLVWVVGYIRTDRPPDAAESHGPRVAFSVAVALLAVSGTGAAFVSDWFIHALRPTIDQLGISEAFAGLVIVAIAGNAVENTTGLVLANKGQADLAVSVVKNSVAQIAAFLFPVLVLASLLFTTPLTFAIAPVYVGALLLTALAVWQVTGDGEAAAFEGWALIGIYVILAALTLYE